MGGCSIMHKNFKVNIKIIAIVVLLVAAATVFYAFIIHREIPRREAPGTLNSEQLQEQSDKSYESTTTTATGVTINAETTAEVLKNMGVGWNLGNTLDACNGDSLSYTYASQKRDKYQIMATYSTKNYSGWDASSVPYFSATTSSCDLTWKITSLNSSMTQQCGKFSFQLINKEIGNIETPIQFTVTKAQFTTATGTVIQLNDMIQSYSKPLKDTVTEYVSSDLTKIVGLATSADLIGGTLSISMKIDQYPQGLGASITKETYYETLWGNPVTTKDTIDMVSQAGFGAVRIPVTYTNHMDENGNIDKAWLDRVAQIVNSVLSDNMYCIINIHHDTGKDGWLKADISTLDTSQLRFQNAWMQIAEYFKDYDQKLLFEGYNEILDVNNKWSNSTSDSYKAANQLNQAFVNTVRNTGGNNYSRNLVVNTYAASVDKGVLDSFVLPSDKVSNHLMVEVHYYGTSQSEQNSVIERLNSNFVSKGIPVMIGECGTTFKVTESDRIVSADYLIRTAKKYNITCFWWDDGNYANTVGAQSNYAILDRVALKWYHPALMSAIIQAAH